MKRGSTLFLKVALFVIGTPIFVLCVFGLPMVAKDTMNNNSEFAFALYGILVAMYVSAIPFYLALFQAYKLLHYIDNNKAFSNMSVNALKTITFCAISISGLYCAALPFFYIFAEIDDAPGFIVIGLVIVFASLVIAVFAAVLQRLLREAIQMKLENDLTV